MKNPQFAIVSWQEILEPIRAELELVEERFRSELVSSVPEVTAIGQYLQVSGGKRLRPSLLLLAAKLAGGAKPPAISLAAVVEMIHTATLVHDDVIDGADLRRGSPSTNSRWGNHTSVLAGDWLYMQTFRIALQERNFRVLDILIDLTQLMVEGELIQWGMLGRLDLTVEEHLDLVYRKTACLFEACTRLGAVLARQDAQTENRLAEYGRNLGMAFQLVDDLLDFTASEAVLGKPVGSDLREGKVTLPLIYLLARCTPDTYRKIASVVQNHRFQAMSWEDLLGFLWQYNIPEAVKQRAQLYSQNALKCLEGFPDSSSKRALFALPDFIINREH
ncbi:MAG: polyprenyl synthetase family protein [Acidobacteria bacterium]|nr:polyprenyl synthetase family protein [Acidobacteriota bacterium]